MRLLAVCAAAAVVLGAAVDARGQEPPPPIPFFVLDLHGTVANFPSDDAQLAASRGMQLAELPGSGFGVQASLHLYLVRIKVVTVGIGAEVAASRSRQTPPPTSTFPVVRPSEERFSTFAPQLSLNFGNGHGWSYLSGGVGVSNWALVPQGQEGFPADSEPLETLNYGGGARWFAKKHIAFSLDVRVYVVSPGTPYLAGAPGSPHTNLLVIGAGLSLK